MRPCAELGDALCHGPRAQSQPRPFYPPANVLNRWHIARPASVAHVPPIIIGRKRTGYEPRTRGGGNGHALKDAVRSGTDAPFVLDRLFKVEHGKGHRIFSSL